MNMESAKRAVLDWFREEFRLQNCRFHLSTKKSFIDSKCTYLPSIILVLFRCCEALACTGLMVLSMAFHGPAIWFACLIDLNILFVTGYFIFLAVLAEVSLFKELSGLQEIRRRPTQVTVLSEDTIACIGDDVQINPYKRNSANSGQKAFRQSRFEPDCYQTCNRPRGSSARLCTVSSETSDYHSDFVPISCSKSLRVSCISPSMSFEERPCSTSDQSVTSSYPWQLSGSPKPSSGPSMWIKLLSFLYVVNVDLLLANAAFHFSEYKSILQPKYTQHSEFVKIEKIILCFVFVLAPTLVALDVLLNTFRWRVYHVIYPLIVLTVYIIFSAIIYDGNKNVIISFVHQKINSIDTIKSYAVRMYLITPSIHFAIFIATSLRDKIQCPTCNVSIRKKESCMKGLMSSIGRHHHREHNKSTTVSISSSNGTFQKDRNSSRPDSGSDNSYIAKVDESESLVPHDYRNSGQNKRKQITRSIAYICQDDQRHAHVIKQNSSPVHFPSRKLPPLFSVYSSRASSFHNSSSSIARQGNNSRSSVVRQGSQSLVASDYCNIASIEDDVFTPSEEIKMF